MYETGPNIWICDGPAINGIAGFHYPTRMVIIRLGQGVMGQGVMGQGSMGQDAAAGGLWIWSPVALTQELCAEIDALGPVQALIAPNAFHDSHLSAWAAAYPEAQIYAAPRLRALRPDIRFSADLSDTPPTEWAGEIDQRVIPGNKMLEEVVFFHPASGTVIFCDLLQQLPKDWYRGWRRLIARLDAMSGPEPQVPRKFRMAFRDRPAARQALNRIRHWPATRLVMAHGPIVDTDVPGLLKRAFRFL